MAWTFLKGLERGENEMKADGLKTGLAFLNKFLSTPADKEGKIKMESYVQDHQKYCKLMAYKKDVGIAYCFPFEQAIADFSIAVCVKDLQEIMKGLKKSDEVELDLSTTKKFILRTEKDTLEIEKWVVKKHVPLTWEKKVSIPVEYWENVMGVHSMLTSKSLYDFANSVFFHMEDHKLETINTNGAIFLYNSMDSAVSAEPFDFIIPHDVIGMVLKWGNLIKGDTIEILSSGSSIRFSDGSREIYVRKDEHTFFPALKTVLEKTFDGKIYDVEELEGNVTVHKDGTADIFHVKIQEKFLKEIQSLSGWSMKIPDNCTDPIILEKDDGETDAKIWILPIDPEKQG